MDEQNKKALENKANDAKEEKGGKKGKMKIILALVLTIVLAGGTGAGIYFYWQGTNYLTTDNARVTTTLVTVVANAPGALERFTAFEGQYVEENEVLGWVENGEALRAPFDGIVVQASAVQDQVVSPMEPLLVIADMNDLHIITNIEETDIARIQVGQPAVVTIDPFGSQQFNGYVAEIGRTTAAELTGQALFFNTGGTFTRVTHLIPVRINIMDDVNLGSFIGVNARVRIPVADHAAADVDAQPLNISARGVVESIESRNVYSTLGFMVDHIYVVEGDQVTAGQVLGVLDTEDLELTIAQQRAALELARQNSRNAIGDTQRMLNEASANLANNTNVHILSAEASLSAAEANLTAVRNNYDDAVRDYTEGNNPQLVAAESFLITATVERDRIETNHTNLLALYAGGIVSSDELRQSESALTHARNQYNDARVGYENALLMQERTLEQLRIALQSATTAHQNAQTMLGAARIAAAQDIERLRSVVTGAEISGNLEHMEIALAQLEKHLEDSTITAPISGTVTAVIAREGAVGMGLLFVVEDTESLKVITSFREYDIGRIAAGMEVRITTDATGNADYTGVISRINPAAMAHSPVVEFEAEVLVTSVNTGLRIGMNARLDIYIE